MDLTMSELPKIRSVKSLGGYRLELAFNDGAHGAHDLAWLFAKIGPMNQPLRDEAFFARVFLENGALTWPNGYELSPWNIRERMQTAGELRLPTIAAE